MPADPTNNNTRNGIVGASVKLGQALIGALPPAFLLLCLLNIAFLGIVMWFIDQQIEQRTEIVTKVIEHCFEDKK
jgi:uncharacterized membrane-anchored protein YitT (DUF2179 family)